MSSIASTARASLDLSGEWSARIDPGRTGEAERWFAGPLVDAAPVRLPGSAQTQGIGEAPGVDTEWVGGSPSDPYYVEDRYARFRGPEDFKIPFFLQPDLVHVGVVWYQREIEVDERTAGDVLLTLERVHWESTVWVDTDRIGSDRSLTTPHRYRIPALAAGVHRLTIRVDNSMLVDVGPNAHSVSDHTQGGWNGIVGGLTLESVAPARITALTVVPDVAARSVAVRLSLEADSLDGATGSLTIAARPLADGGAPVPEPLVVPVRMEPERFTRGRATTATHLDVTVPLGADARLWDEFDPFVYELAVTFDATSRGGTSTDRRTTRFGLRAVEAIGTRIHVNGRPIFLRGTLECAVFPLTGYPPTDEPAWARIFATCQAFGLNHVRFHSWCPPEAAFRAADAAGVYLQVEGPIWANQGAAIGEGRDVDDFLAAETARILDEYGDHPSFLLMAHGNEPAGRDEEFLAAWVQRWRRQDPRHLYTSGAGWPSIDASDYDCVPGPRIHAWGEGLGSRVNALPPETTTDYADWVQRTPRPIVTHEAGQWCVFLDFDEIEKYTGLMKARNFEIARTFLDDAGMLDAAPAFLHASGRLQVIVYKEEVESALRTPGFGGIQLLGLNDFPGQGTAPVGVIDAFWDTKAYTTSAEWSRFFSATVPLALLPKRTFRADEPITARIRVAHFGATPIDGEVRWRLVDDDGRTLDDGTSFAGTIAIGNEGDYGTITASAAVSDRARRLRLVVDVAAGGVVVAENDWEVWVYPELPLAADGVTTTRSLPEAIELLAAGRTVLFLPPSAEVASPVELGFSPVFWNTSWTGGQAPHTLGILCDPAHPAFAGFPTDGHTNWQWWELLHGARAMDLRGLTSTVVPIVQVVDSWFDARRLGLLLEARVGEGRLLMSTLDLAGDLDDRIVARRLRASLDDYLRSDAFAPTVELTPDDLRRIVG